MSIVIHNLLYYNFVVLDYKYECPFYITKQNFKFNKYFFINMQYTEAMRTIPISIRVSSTKWPSHLDIPCVFYM